MSTEYYLKDITRVLGIKRTALQQWLDRGYVAPSVGAAGGQGFRNVWSKEDVLNLAAFQSLLDHGFSRGEAARALQEKQTLFISGNICERRDRKEFQEEDIFGYDTAIAKVTCLNGAVYNVVVTRGIPETTIFTAIDSAAKFLGVPAGIAAVKVVSITDAMRRAAENL